MLSCVVEPSTGFPAAPALRSAGPAVLALTASSVRHSSAQHGFSGSPSSIYMSPLCPRSPCVQEVIVPWRFCCKMFSQCWTCSSSSALNVALCEMLWWLFHRTLYFNTGLRWKTGFKWMLFVLRGFSPCLELCGSTGARSVFCCLLLYFSLLVLLFVDKNQPTVTFLQLRDLVSWNQQVGAELPD